MEAPQENSGRAPPSNSSKISNRLMIMHPICFRFEYIMVENFEGYTGESEPLFYNYLRPLTSLDEGLYALACEEDVRCLATFVISFKLIEIYIEHGVTALDCYIRPPRFRETIEDISDEPGSIAANRTEKMLCMPDCMLTPPTDESVITYTQLSGVQAGFADVARGGVESYGLSHDESFGVDDLDLNLNKSVNLNVSQIETQSELDVSEEPDVGRTQEPIVVEVSTQEPIMAEVSTQAPIVEKVGTQEFTVEDVVLEDYVSSGEDAKHCNGQEDELAPSDGQFFYDDRGIYTAYETEYDVQSSEDAGTDDDDDKEDFLIDEENEIVEPDVDVHLFGISMDLPFDNIGVTNLVPDDVLEGKDVDVINPDGFDSDPGNDDETNDYRRRRLAKLSREMEGVINASSQWKYSFYTGQKYTTPKEAKDIVYLYSIKSRRNLELYKNDNVRIRVRCDRKVHVFTMSQGTGPTGPNHGMEAGPSGSSGPTTRSKKRKNTGTNDDSQASSSVLNAHDKGDLCPWVLEIKHCTYKFLSEKIFDQVRVNPDIPVKAVQDQLQRDLEVQISMSKAFRAKAKAEREIRGDHVLQYSMLRDYVVELQSTNPNTTVKIAVERNTDPSLPTRVFQRIYVCLGALKLGFRACKRDLLGLDGAFMKGPFPGQVLAAVGLDSNNGIYPLAYALVEAESKSSWCWFLQCLGDDIDLHPNSNFTFISDRQKGIIPAIKTVFPSAEHRYCLRHIHENMKQGWCGQAYKDLLWRAASATSVKEFEKCMLELKTMNPKAHEWLNKIPPEHWARSHFSGRAKFDLLLNNICEVFNGKIVGGRDKPVITLLEYIREYCMKRIVNVQSVIEKCSLGDQCVVDVVTMTCSCRKWKLIGIPCKHAVSACWNMALNDRATPPPEAWVNPCYWLTTWRETYSHKVGRPRKKTKRSKHEDEPFVKDGKLSRKRRTITCQFCGNTGHNKATCKGQGANNAEAGSSASRQTEPAVG
ncbi:heat stress transcription factor B-4-like protein [Tanacetum coccineum]